MCTVSYIPLIDGFMLTSNRDELNIRPTSPPEIHIVAGEKIIFPKDELAGGSWIASDGNLKKVCLLNGGFTTYKNQLNYTKSRGKVLLESFTYNSAKEFSEKVNLEHVAPFTLLLFFGKTQPEIHRFIWDGENKFLNKIDFQKNHIWSSAALYDENARALREKWFANWLKDNEQYDDYRIMDFHQFKHSDNEQVDILMKRENNLETVSITQIISQEENQTFKYFDLVHQKHYQKIFKIMEL